MISKELIAKIKSEFILDLNGIHGIRHWVRVRANGLKLVHFTGANAKVVELFAFLPDSRRQNENRDRNHGLRAAEFVQQINESLLFLDDRELELLTFACTHHSEGLLDGDITIQTCWDADRLDLGRIGIRPNPQYLCTEAARKTELIEWAYQRSQRNYLIKKKVKFY